MTSSVPIVLQYRNFESVRHLGGIAVYFNEVQNWLKFSNLDRQLSESIHLGSEATKSSLGDLFDFLFRSSLFLASRIDRHFHTKFAFYLHTKKAVILKKALISSKENTSKLVYHHMNNFILPDFKLFFLSRKYNIEFLATIVDFLDVDFPEKLPNEVVKVREVTRNFIFDVSTLMLPIADFIRDDCVRLRASEAKLKVIKWGTDHSSQECTIPENKEHSDVARYFVFPAKSWKHKGHLEFLETFLASPLSNYRLVFIGDTSSIDSEIRELLERYPNRKHNVEVLGFVPDREKAVLFEGSSGIVLPSSYEGFGFPYFEAIRIGKPLFCFKTKAYDEYFGGCNNPGVTEVHDFEGLHRLLVDFRIEEHLKPMKAMREIVRDASWEKSCKSLSSVYSSLINVSREV
jgi:glycosyltransferase involved in cell wall biosynthesis